MAGIPDGMGAFALDDSSFKLLMNHELGSGVGVMRQHGSKGAFVSQWLISRDPVSLVVSAGKDHGLAPNEETIQKDVFRMQRIEDGAWDPRRQHANDFYMVTTASLTSNSRPWRWRFDDIEHPEKCGTIEILPQGNEGHKMLDNIGMDNHGRLIMQEDPGGNDRLAKVWLHNVDKGNLVEIAEHNPKFFDRQLLGPGTPGPAFLTTNEESSGVFDAEGLLGRGWFLLDVQAHTANPDPELIEEGQLLAIYVDPTVENNDDGIIP